MLRFMKRKIILIIKSKSNSNPTSALILTTACITGIAKVAEETVGCREIDFMVEKHPMQHGCLPGNTRQGFLPGDCLQ